MPKLALKLLAALALLAPVPAMAKEKVTLALNWVPTADHAPYFYAKRQGWYDQADIELTIENGSGSAVSAQRVGAGQSNFGIADMATALLARGKGANLVAIMTVYANSPQGFLLAQKQRHRRSEGFRGQKARQSRRRRLAGDVAGLRQAGGDRPGRRDVRQRQPASEGRLAQKPCHRHHQRLLQRS